MTEVLNLARAQSQPTTRVLPEPLPRAAASIYLLYSLVISAVHQCDCRVQSTPCCSYSTHLASLSTDNTSTTVSAKYKLGKNMSDGFVAPVRSKRPKNTKGLSLTAEALAPPPLSENGSEDDYNLDAYVTQATPKPAVGQLNGGGGGGEHSLHQSSSTLSVPKVSSISRKKPVGLGIRSTRPAPDVPSKSDGVLLSPSGSFMSNASSNHSISSRAEMERELASMEISSSSTRSGSKSKKSAAENGDEPKSTTKKTKKKSEKPESEFSELKDEDLKLMGELGCGNGGTVNKVIHKSSGRLMAKKLILIDAKPAVRKQILRELQIMYHCSSEWIVTFYGAFLCDVHVGICMEFMDRG